MNRFVKHYLRLQHDVHVVCSWLYSMKSDILCVCNRPKVLDVNLAVNASRIYTLAMFEQLGKTCTRLSPQGGRGGKG
jgi:hypothetical protein